MKAKLQIPTTKRLCGYKEIEVDIPNDVAEELLEESGSKKQTGYERVEKNECYYAVNAQSEVIRVKDEMLACDDQTYSVANYYSSEEIAQNNARADKLMRQLRRFAVEHRKRDLNWCDQYVKKYYIEYDCEYNALEIDFEYAYRKFGGIYFDTKAAATVAIETFYDELIWYFTEYKDSL